MIFGSPTLFWFRIFSHRSDLAGFAKRSPFRKYCRSKWIFCSFARKYHIWLIFGDFGIILGSRSFFGSITFSGSNYFRSNLAGLVKKILNRKGFERKYSLKVKILARKRKVYFRARCTGKSVLEGPYMKNILFKQKYFWSSRKLNTQNRGRARPDQAGELGSSGNYQKARNRQVYSDLGSFWGIIFAKSVCRKIEGFRAIQRLRALLVPQNPLKPL